MPSNYAWMNGELVPFEHASVPLLTPTLHYGVGVFEGIRCYETPQGPAVFRLSEHLERFLDSIHILGVRDFPYSCDQMRAAVHETIKANSLGECYIRPLMYLQGPMGMDMDKSVPKLAIAAWEWGPYLGEEARQSGIHLMVSSFTRLHPNISLTKAKLTGNYVNSLLVKTLALRSGYDEAVILDPEGFVAECSGENLFMVRSGILYTPPLAQVLEGITRNTILTLARDLDIPIQENLITRDQLYIADEVFITGTAAEVVPVRMVDFRKIGQGKPGSITKSIMRLFSSAVHGLDSHSRDWLDYLETAEPIIGRA